MAIINHLAKRAANFSQQFDTALTQGLTKTAEALPTSVEPRAIDIQASTLAEDLKTKWHPNITSGEMGEASYNLMKTVKSLEDKSPEAIENVLYNTAGVYAKHNNTELSSTLKNLEDAVNPYLEREGLSKVYLTAKNQEYFNKLHQIHGNAINNSKPNVNRFKEMDPILRDKIVNQSQQNLRYAANSLEYVGKNLTGDAVTDVNILGHVVKGMNNEKIQEYKKIINSQIKRNEKLNGQTIDTLITNLRNPRRSANDILQSYNKLKLADLNDYSRAELKDMLNEMDYLLKNRREVTATKNVSSQQWQDLIKAKSVVNKALAGSDFGADKPFKNLNGIEEGTTIHDVYRDNDKFIRQRTGQTQSTGINYQSGYEFSGKVDEADLPVGIGSLTFPKSYTAELLERGTAGNPELNKKFWTQMEGNNLDPKIIEHYGPPGAAPRAGEIFTAEEIKDNFYAAAASDIRYKGDGRDVKSFARSSNAAIDKENGEVLGYYWLGNIKLKMLQDFFELQHGTLSHNIKTGKGYPNIDTTKTLFDNKIGKDISQQSRNLVNDIIKIVGGDELDIGMKKILKAYPAYFDRLLTAQQVDNFRMLDKLAKDFYVKGSYLSDLPKAIKESNLGNVNELLDFHAQLIDNTMNYVSKLQSKFIVAQQLDLPSSMIRPYLGVSAPGEAAQETFELVHGEYAAIRSSDAEKANYIANTDTDNSFNNAPWAKFVDEDERFIKNIDETYEEDWIKESYIKQGGQPDIDHYHKFNKYSKVRNNEIENFRNSIKTITKVAKTKMTQDDITEMRDLLTMLKGTPTKDKNGNQIWPDRFTLSNKINIIAAHIADDITYPGMKGVSVWDAVPGNVPVLPSIGEEAFEYLVDLKSFFEQKLDYFRNKTMMPNSDMDRRIKLLTTRAIENIITDIDRNLQSITTNRFKAQNALKDEYNKSQGFISDSTQLDYMMEKGEFDMNYSKSNTTITTPKPKNFKRTIKPLSKEPLEKYNKIKEQYDKMQKKLSTAQRLLSIATTKGLPIAYQNKITIPGLQAEIANLKKSIEPIKKQYQDAYATLKQQDAADLRFMLLDGVVFKSAASPDNASDFVQGVIKKLTEKNWAPSSIANAREVTRNILMYNTMLSAKNPNFSKIPESAVTWLRDNGLTNVTIYDTENRANLLRLYDLLDAMLEPQKHRDINNFLFGTEYKAPRTTKPNESNIDFSGKKKSDKEMMDEWLAQGNQVKKLPDANKDQRAYTPDPEEWINNTYNDTPSESIEDFLDFMPDF